MVNPHEQLKEYLERLIHRFLNMKSMNQQLKDILSWRQPSRIDTLNRGAYFFQLATYSLSRIVLTELSTLLSHKEERSLHDWLVKAHEHASSLKPTRYNPNYSNGDREPIKVGEYRGIIDGHLDRLAEWSELVKKIKGRRDMAIAHFDKKYFDDPKVLYKDFPIRDEDVDELIDVMASILREHYGHLFSVGLTMEVSSLNTLDAVLEYTRAFMRARSDKNLIYKGFQPRLYLGDQYGE